MKLKNSFLLFTSKKCTLALLNFLDAGVFFLLVKNLYIVAGKFTLLIPLLIGTKSNAENDVFLPAKFI